MEAKSKRSWTLETARAILDEVRRHTESAVGEVEPLLAERERAAEDTPERREVDSRIQRRISVWIRSMEALGLEVKGLWLVDFDNGSGYYCWRWPEERIEWYHGHDEGHADRVRIQ